MFMLVRMRRLITARCIGRWTYRSIPAGSACGAAAYARGIRQGDGHRQMGAPLSAQLCLQAGSAAGQFVAKILQGAKPADLPVEEPLRLVLMRSGIAIARRMYSSGPILTLSIFARGVCPS